MLRYLTFILLFLIAFNTRGQINIVSSFLNTYDVSAESLCKCVLNCTQPNLKVNIYGTLTDQNGAGIAESRTISLTLNKGLNNISNLKNSLASEFFEHNAIAQYILVNHRMPSGKFTHCIKVVSVDGEVMAENCDELESLDNSFLTLVSPGDKDTIDSQTPLLTWTHSDPFSLLAPDQYFKLILVEMDKKGEEPEDAIMTEPPHYLNDNVRSHVVLYPAFAKELMEGKTYAWQIQKISMTDNAIIQQSEVWSFVIRQPKTEKDNKYTTLREKIDASFYYASNNKIFFQFEEDYYSESIKCKVFNTKHEAMVPQVINEAKKSTNNQPAVNAKVIGYNAYELDLNDYNLKSGYYYMEVLNEKNKKYTLKFYVD